MRFVRRFFKIMSWSPIKKQPWYFHLFHSLWTWGAVILLMLSMPSWLGHTVAIGGAKVDPLDATKPDLFDYNQPIALPDGRCMVIETREMVQCQPN